MELSLPLPCSLDVSTDLSGGFLDCMADTTLPGSTFDLPGWNIPFNREGSASPQYRGRWVEVRFKCRQLQATLLTPIKACGCFCFWAPRRSGRSSRTLISGT